VRADDEPIAKVAVSYGGQLAACGSEGGSVAVCNVKTAQVVARSIGNGNRVLSIAFSPDGQKFATGHERGIVVWKTAGLERLRELKEFTEGAIQKVQQVRFSDDQRRIFAAFGKRIAVFEVSDGKSEDVFPPQTSPE
jgi:WD40 repeat protein